MTLEREQRVRILTIDGKVSTQEYFVEMEKPDRKGYVSLIEVGANRKIKVNQRRVLSDCEENNAFVVEVGDKYRASCPDCSFVEDVSPSDESITCPNHSVIQLQWKNGERPVSDAATTEKKNDKVKPNATKKEKPIKEPIVVDFDKLKKNSTFELWTKKSVQFDHEKIDVQAHVLLIKGDSPRKLCFNTYDGTLGKKGKALPIDGFVKDEAVDGKKTWYQVKNIDKTVEKLGKDGYEKQ